MLEKLNGREIDSAEMTHALDLYRDILAIQASEKERILQKRPFAGLPDRRDGQSPLVGFQDIAMDLPEFADACFQIFGLLSPHLDLAGEEEESLREMIREKEALAALLQQWYETSSFPETVPENLRKVLSILLQAALRPYLAPFADAADRIVDQDSWRRTVCPVCGGRPDFAFLKGEYGSRWLSCSRCDFEWIFQRIQCPFCGSRDHEVLSYFTVSDERYRVYVCDSCKRYIKALDLSNMAEESLIPLEKILTAGLDILAREKGYQ